MSNVIHYRDCYFIHYKKEMEVYRQKSKIDQYLTFDRFALRESRAAQEIKKKAEKNNIDHLKCCQCRYPLKGIRFNPGPIPLRSSTRYPGIGYHYEIFPPIQKETILCPECGFANELRRSEDNIEWELPHIIINETIEFHDSLMLFYSTIFKHMKASFIFAFSLAKDCFVDCFAPKRNL